MKKTNEELIEKYRQRYSVLEKEGFKKLELLEGEEVRHCIDDTGMKFYKMCWAVTSKGRVWSLSQNRWHVPWINGKYWRVANTYVHLLVNHYFMTDEDKFVLRVVEENNKKVADSEKWHIEVHHLKSVENIDYKTMSKDERIYACMAVNSKEDLKCQIKETDHVDDHRIMRGKQTRGEEKGTERFDCFTRMVMNSCDSNSTTYISYDENGKRMINMTLKLKGTTPEEDEELDRTVSHKFNYF